MRKRIKAQPDAPGFEVVMEAPLHYSNVMLVDPVSRKPVRSRAAWTESGDKTRVGVGKRASGAPLPKPRAWLQDAGPDSRVGAKDTAPEEALRVTRADALAAAADGEPARPDYVAGKLAPPRPAWLPPPSPSGDGMQGGGGAAEAAALAYEERVEAWARRAYERGLQSREEREAAAVAAAGGQQQQVRRASTLAAEEQEDEAEEEERAAGRRRRQQQRRWILARTGAPGLGPLGRLAGVLSALRLG
jgi:ribosomal protein L24